MFNYILKLLEYFIYPYTKNIFSDEDEVNNHYAEMSDNHNLRTLSSNYSPLNTAKHSLVNSARPEYPVHPLYVGPQDSSQTTNRNFPSSSLGTANCVREQPRANNDQEMKSQVTNKLY